MIRFLKDRMSSISSDLYEEILKPNKSHTNCIIQIVPCKTALIAFLIKINNEKLDQVITSKNLIFEHSLTCVNYKLFISAS